MSQLLKFLLQIRGHNKAQLDPLGILQADLSDSIPADLSLEYWGLGKLCTISNPKDCVCPHFQTHRGVFLMNCLDMSSQSKLQ